MPAGRTSATVSGLRLPAANAVTLVASAAARKAATSSSRHGRSLRRRGVGRHRPHPAGAAPVQPVRARVAPAEPCSATLRCRPASTSCCRTASSATSSSPRACAGRHRLPRRRRHRAAGPRRPRSPLHPAAPATLVVRCDKSRCGGGAIQDNQLQVNLEPTGDLAASPACTAKGFMSGPDGHCVDYVQSKRDGRATPTCTCSSLVTHG